MNVVNLIGRLTRDIELKYTADTQMAIAKFSVAVDGAPGKDGKKRTDFPSVVAFGKTAENCSKYLQKGRMIGVTGRIQTGSYKDKDGKTVYTTSVVADRIHFIDWGDKVKPQEGHARKEPEEVQDSFAAIDEDIPF